MPWPRLAITAATWTLALAACSPGAPPPRPAPQPTQDATPQQAAPPPSVAPAVSPTPTPAGVVVPYRVEVHTTDQSVADFPARVHEILTDPRGWVRAGFTFVPDPAAEYLIVLAEGADVDRLCKPMDTYGQYSCQNGPVVALNADRWRSATPQWTGDLGGYRVMLVNHEVGHLLHLHHPVEHCPGPGLPAPVMAQQSTELGQCRANPWPLQWEVKLAAQRREPLAPPASHDPFDHRPTPPPVDQ